MFTKITLIANAALSVAIILGGASAAQAAPPSGNDLQQCIAGLQASGRSFGVDPDNGVTEYDVMVGRCQDRLYRQSQSRQSR